jgi:protein translocase SecG subunit
VLSCLLLVCLILVQRSKSEGLGMAFGAGAGEALFGARAGNVLSKATVVLGIVFMATTLVLGVLFAQRDKALIDTYGEEPATVPAMQAQPLEGMDLGMPEVMPAMDETVLPAETTTNAM